MLQDAPRRYIEVIEPVRVEMGDKFAELLPNPNFEVDFTIDFSHPRSPTTSAACVNEVGDEDFPSHPVVRGRSVSWYEVERRCPLDGGLARNGVWENAVVLDEKVLNR